MFNDKLYNAMKQSRVSPPEQSFFNKFTYWFNFYCTRALPYDRNVTLIDRCDEQI